MDAPREKLGLSGEERVDVINVKLSDPLLADMVVQQDGYFRGYHISRGNWISILLDGTVPVDEICRWIDESYAVTASKKQSRSSGQQKSGLFRQIRSSTISSTLLTIQKRSTGNRDVGSKQEIRYSCMRLHRSLQFSINARY